MAQSIFQDKRYLEFDKYTKTLMRNWKKYNMDEQDRHTNNWLKGRQKMEQLAQAYGMELKTPYPKFARKQDLDNIVWVKSKIGDQDLEWGIWEGEDHVLVGKKHVFNQNFLDYMTFGIKDPEKANKKLAELIVLFNGAEMKRGM